MEAVSCADRDKWLAAMGDGLQSMQNNKGLELIDLPEF